MGPKEADGSATLRGLNLPKSSVKIYIYLFLEPHGCTPTLPNRQNEVRTNVETKESRTNGKPRLIATKTHFLFISKMTLLIYLFSISCLPQYMYTHAHTHTH